MTDVALAIIGMGKMGQSVAELAPSHGCHIVATIGGSPGMSREVTRQTLNGAHVAIEFTVPNASPGHARACAAAGCPIVVGTTGWYGEMDDVRSSILAHGGAMLTAPNFSLGVAIFERVVAEAARLCGAAAGYDACLIETHHAAKRDAPSGTAIALAATAAAAFGRSLPIASVRVGTVPGTHELLFDAPYEQIRLVHEARDRRIFAAGALIAARWLVGRQGVFTMQDVLGASLRSPDLATR